MDEERSEQPAAPADVAAIVKQAVEEFVKAQHEPAYRAELDKERLRREQLEQKLNEVVEENRRGRQAAEEAERHATIRSELQKLGVGKVDLVFRVVKDDVVRGDDGRLIAKAEHGDVALRDYLAAFLRDNPEFLPARIAGGSGVTGTRGTAGGGVDLEKIRPGMSREELDQARQEIARIASRTLKGIS